MSDSIYLFNKTREKRLEEFRDVLCSRDTPVLASQIADEWSITLQNFIEPAGWQALWKISRQICEELNIVFPKFVLVKVLEVNFQELTALVDVEGVQDDISIPVKQEVPLIQLYPTKRQEHSSLNIDYTSNFIDQLRFFYNHLWCPWDLEESDEGDWPSKFLEQRLQMYYEMNDGTIPNKLADKIQRCREQAHKLYEQKQKLESLLIVNGDVEEIASPKSQDYTYELMQTHIQLNPLLSELQMLENASMRKLIINHFLKEERKMNSLSAIVVWQNGFLKEFINFLTVAEETIHPEMPITSVPSFQSAVETAVSGNSIFLYDGVHHANLHVECDLSIKGLGDSLPLIVRKESSQFLLSARNANVKIANIKLNAADVLNVFQVFKNATVEFINCHFFCDQSMTGRGIVVNSGGSVLVTKCSFSGLNVAICCQSGSQLNIKDSDFVDCGIGIETFENCGLQICDSSIRNSKRAAIFVTHLGESSKTGKIDLVKEFQGLSLKKIQLLHNKTDAELNGVANLSDA